MARKATTAPQPVTESFGATLPAVAQAEADFNVSRDTEIADAEERFTDGEDYDEDRLMMVANGVASRVALEYAVGGAALIRIKARKGHGGFLEFVQARCNFSADTAQKMMLVARALLLPNNQPRPLLTSISTSGKGAIGKAMALSSLSHDELNALDAGETVNGMTIGSIEVATLRELREELAARDQKIEADADERARHIAEIEAADREIRRLKRGGREVEEDNHREALDGCRVALDEALGGSEKLLATIGIALTELDLTTVPATMDGIEKRNVVMNAINRVNQLAETLARLQQGAAMTFATYIDDAQALLLTSGGDE